MKHYYKNLLLAIIGLLISFGAFAQVVKYSDSQGAQGITVQKQNMNGMTLNYSIHEFSMEDLNVDGEMMKTVHLPDVFSCFPHWDTQIKN